MRRSERLNTTPTQCSPSLDRGDGVADGGDRDPHRGAGNATSYRDASARRHPCGGMDDRMHRRWSVGSPMDRPELPIIAGINCATWHNRARRRSVKRLSSGNGVRGRGRCYRVSGSGDRTYGNFVAARCVGDSRGGLGGRRCMGSSKSTQPIRQVAEYECVAVVVGVADRRARGRGAGRGAGGFAGRTLGRRTQRL